MHERHPLSILVVVLLVFPVIHGHNMAAVTMLYRLYALIRVRIPIRNLLLSAVLMGLFALPIPALGQTDARSQRIAGSELLSSAQGEFVTRTFVHDGRTRTYNLYVPAAYDGSEEWPLVISFHGYSWSLTNHAWLDGMSAVADTAHFLVAYPRGLNIFVGGFGTNVGWNVDGGFGTWDDYAFTSQLIDHIAADYAVDLRRVHATGFSFGSMMASGVACRLADRIASIAGDAGPLQEVFFEDCPATRPISTMLIFGTDDPVHHYTGYPLDDFAPRPIPETPSFWARHNGCSLDSLVTEFPDVDTTDNSTVTRIEYPDCQGDTEVLFYRVNGGGHTWPGRPGQRASLGNVNMDIDATALIWEFFKRHPHPSNSSATAWNTSLVGFWPSPDITPHEVAVGSGVACVREAEWATHSADRMWLVDTSDPTNPVGVASTEDMAAGITAIDGSRAYVLSGVPGNTWRLLIYEVSDPTNPTKIVDFDTNGDAAGLAIRDGYAYVAVENSEQEGMLPPGLLIINVENPAIPEVVTFVETTRTDHMTFALGDAYAYVASPPGFGSERGMHVIDITTGEKVAFDEMVERVFAVTDNTVFVEYDAWGGGSISVLDMTDPANPLSLGSIGSAIDFTVRGDYAFSITLDGLRIRDLRQLPDPPVVGYFLTPGVAHGVAVDDAYIYVAADDGLYILRNDLATPIEESRGHVPDGFSLGQNYPNPFNPTTTISYTLPRPADVTLTAYDLLGRQVRLLASGTKPAGTYEVTFDASGLSSGLYLYRLQAGTYVETRRMVVVR